MIKVLVKQLCPPILYSKLCSLRNILRRRAGASSHDQHAAPGQQDLGVYWSPGMAEALETWGAGNAWDEIQFLLVNLRGKVLDISCGTGKTIELLSPFTGIEVHGCDISDFLIRKAVERGIPPARLKVGDATSLDYEDDAFDYSYSIGSLEHFTEEGIGQFIQECRRVTRYASFHQLPVARSGTDKGWIKTVQSYFNNSVPWWLAKFRSHYDTVWVLDSRWSDDISVGKWFVCVKGHHLLTDGTAGEIASDQTPDER